MNDETALFDAALGGDVEAVADAYFAGEQPLARELIRVLKLMIIDPNAYGELVEHKGLLGTDNPYFRWLSPVNRSLQVVLQLTDGQPFVDRGDGRVSWTDRDGHAHEAPKPDDPYPDFPGLATTQYPSDPSKEL